MMKTLCAILCSLLLLIFVAPQSGDALLFYGYGGESGLGFFEGSLTYTPLKDNATLEIWLKNTTPEAWGGYITGFAFNNPDIPGIKGAISGISFSDPDFDLIGGPAFDNGINAMPLGYFDIGAALGGDWMGGGDPKPGLGFNESRTFTFQLTGTGLTSLNEMMFLNELSSGGSPGMGGQFFGARFRGFTNGGSDKVPGNPDPIPEPGTLVLLGSGLVGFGAFGWMRRRKS